MADDHPTDGGEGIRTLEGGTLVAHDATITGHTEEWQPGDTVKFRPSGSKAAVDAIVVLVAHDGDGNHVLDVVVSDGDEQTMHSGVRELEPGTFAA